MVAIATLAKFMNAWVMPAYLRVPRPLSAGIPSAAMDEFITVAIYDTTTPAHIALGRLAAEGITAVLFDENLVQMSWGYSIAVGGIKLRVARADAAAARRVLETDYSAALNDVDLGKPEA